MGHEDFQIELEKDARGVLAHAEKAALTEHLASCPECRAFQSTLTFTQQRMTTMNQNLAETMMWPRTYELIRQAQKRPIYEGVALLLGTVLVSLPLYSAIQNGVPLTNILILAVPSVIGVGLLVRSWFGWNRTKGGDPVANARLEAARTLRESRVYQAVLVVSSFSDIRFAIVGVPLIIALELKRIRPLKQDLSRIG